MIILDLKLEEGSTDNRIYDHVITLVDPEETERCTKEAMLALCNKPDLFDQIKPPVQEDSRRSSIQGRPSNQNHPDAVLQISGHAEIIPEWKAKLQDFLLSDLKIIINTGMNTFGLLMVMWLEIILQFPANTETMFYAWLWISVVINLYFGILLALHFVAFGSNWVFTKKPVLVFEIFLQCIPISAACIFIAAMFKSGNARFQLAQKGTSMQSVVFIARIGRLVFLLREIETLDIILSTFQCFSEPFLDLMMSVYIIFYMFSQIGYILYTGKITTVSAAGNNLFYLMKQW